MGLPVVVTLKVFWEPIVKIVDAALVTTGRVPGTTPQPLLLQPSKPVAVTVHWAKPVLPPESKTATSAPLDSTLDVIALPGTTPQPLLLQP